MSDKKSATPIVGQNPRQQIIKKKKTNERPERKVNSRNGMEKCSKLSDKCDSRESRFSDSLKCARIYDAFN